MLKRTLICLFLIHLTFSTGTSLDIIQGREGKELLQKLSATSSIGRDLISAIQLELTTEDENLLDYIIGLLHDVKNQVTEQAGTLQQTYDQRDAECMEGTVEIAEAITTVTGELVTKRELLPARQTEYDTKVEEKATVEEENEFYSSELIIVEEQNTRRRAAYEAQRDEHDALTAALEQARGIIRQLLSGSFLQTKGEILAQLDKHREFHTLAMKAEHNNKLFTLLMEMASDASKKGSDDAVQAVIDILDELIQAEEAARTLEAKAEQTRTGIYLDTVARLNTNLESNNAKLLDLQADIFTVTTRLRELNNAISELSDELAFKKQELADHKAFCLASNADLQARLDNYEEILRLLNQVILLMEHSSIQGVRNMVDGIDPASITELVEIDENADDPSYNPLDN